MSRRRHGTTRRTGSALRRLAGALGVVAAAAGLLVVAPAPVALAVQSPTSCSGTVALQTGGFELPVIKENSFAYVTEAQVPGWLTTASDKRIEIWRTPFQNVPAGSGSQFAELNATQASTLYQDVSTTPGQTLRWELQHRGRAGVDVMAVHIGAPVQPLGVGTQQGPLISDGRTAWGTYAGLYTVPPGQTRTRFSFKAVSTATGDPTVGNFLDSISFGTGACLVTTSTVTTRSGGGSGTTANVGEVLTYTVATSNGGGNPAKNAVVVDTLPPDVEFVPGSIRAITASATQVRTDVAGDDPGEYDAASRTVRVRVGLDSTATAGGTIRPDDARSISYQVRVTAPQSLTTVGNDARVEYRDDLGGGSLVSTSDEVSTPIARAADLETTVARTTPVSVAGSPVTYTATLTNHGPSEETDARLTLDLPRAADGTSPGLTGVGAVVTGGGSCTVAATTVSCVHGGLPVNGTRTVTVTGTIPAGTPAGTPHRFLAASSGAAYDHVPDDNAAQVGEPVTTSADLGVDLTADRSTGVAGGPVVYTAVVTNAGPSVARSVVLSDPLLTGVQFDSATVTSGGGSCVHDGPSATVRCDLGDLAPGAVATVEVRTTLASSGPGAIGNAVTVTSATPDPVGTDNQDEVYGPGAVLSDLSVDLQLPVTEARPGDTVPFTVLITNHGSSDAVNVSLQTVLPPGFVISGVTGITCTPAAGCHVERVAGGATATITGTASVLPDAPAGTTHARARVLSPTPDGNPANDVDDLVFDVLLSADLAVTQTIVNPDDPGGPVVAGGDVHAVSTVTNAGPTRAEDVVVRHTIPAGQLMPVVTPGAGRCDVEGEVESTSDGDRSVDGAVVVCSLDVLPLHASWSVVFDSVVRTSFKDATWSRTRVLTSATPDPEPGDNTHTLAVPAVRHADVQVTKTTSTPSAVETDQVVFEVVVANLGPSDARDLLVRESPQPGVLVTDVTPSAGVYSPANGAWRIPYLPVGEQVSLDVVGTAQSDVTPVVNEAVFLSSATDPPGIPGDHPTHGNDPANDVGRAEVAIVAADRALHVETTAVVLAPAVRADGLRLDDALRYEYVVTNPGNVPMTGISVSDSMLAGGVTCPRTSLAPGGQMTCTANGTHRVTQTDVDAGQAVGGVARVAGRAPDSSSDLVFGAATDLVPVAAAAPALAATTVADWDDADGDDALDAGETVVWTVVVTNTGELTLSDLSVTTPVGPAPVCAAVRLAPGERTSCTSAPYPLTAADAAAGQKDYGASVSAVQPRGSTRLDSAAPGSPVPAAPAPALGLTVAGAVTPAERQLAAALGDPIGWRYVVTNLGNVPVTGVGVDDPEAGVVTCADPELAPGASTACTGSTTHPVAEADVLAGVVAGAATATGTSAVGGVLVRSPVATTSVSVAGPVRALTITATATPSAPQVRTGDSIGFAYTVGNDGNVTMRDVTVGGLLTGTATCLADVLAPGATTTCTAGGTHRVTQAEFDAGLPVTGSATATGTPAGSTTPLVFGPASDPVPVAAAAPGLSVAEVAAWDDADADGALDAGETVQWTAVVENTGDVTLTDLTAEETVAGAMSCSLTELAPGDWTTCTSPVWPAPDADPVTSTATASAADPRGGPRVTGGPASTTTPSSPQGALLASVHATHAVAAPGWHDTLTWRYTVTNIGNVPLSAVAVDDPDGGTITCLATVLDPAETTTCAGDRAVTVEESDLRHGSLSNTAAATGTAAAGPAAIRSADAGHVVHLASVVRALAVVSSASAPAGTPLAAGDTVTYAYVVTNTGNVTLGGLSLHDSGGGSPTCLTTTLGPGESTSCGGGSSYPVTQDDVDAGLPVGLHATVGAVPAGETDPLLFGPADDPLPVVAAAPLLTAVKAPTWADADADDALDAGELITWTVTVTNGGNVRLTDLLVDDPIVYLGCPQTALDPAGAVVCSSDPYVVTDADVAAGERPNTATASALSPRGGPRVTSAPTGTTTVTDPRPALQLALAGVVTPAARQGAAAPGDTVRWRYTVSNPGNVAVTGLAVDDPEGGAVTCSATVLQPGGSTTCAGTSTVQVTETQLFAGGPANEAVATGTPVLGGGTVTSPVAAAVVALAPPRAELALHVTFDDLTAPDRAAAPRWGDVLRARYTLVNTGNVTLGPVGVSDAVFGSIVCASTELAPGATTTCVSTDPYPVGDADLAAGLLASRAEATGAPPAAWGAPVVTVAAGHSVPVRAAAPGPGPAGHPAASGSGTPPAGGRPALARTGVDLVDRLSLAGVLLGAGAAALWVGRRRVSSAR